MSRSRIKHTARKKYAVKKRWKKKSSKKKKRRRKKRLCEKCKRRFDRDILVIHHKENLMRSIPKKDTEGMALKKFNKYYSDGRKRPLHDRRRNVMVVCKDCYDDIMEQKEI